MMLVLASSSPRRRELLAQIGEVFRVECADIPEDRFAGEEAAAYVRRLALEKARAVRGRLSSCADQQELIVLGADTSVVCDEEVLGKPTDSADAARMLRLLSGRSHHVLTGVAVVTSTRESAEVETTRVHFAAMADEEISAYVATGEPFDKAGAYGIQGRAARFIPRIDGCYFNVVGLPLALVAAMLAEARASLRANIPPQRSM